MAEIVGLAASIIQIAGAGITLSTTLYNYVGSASHADNEIGDIASDVEITANALDSVGSVFQSEDAQSIVSKKAIEHANNVVKKCEVVFGEIREVVDKRRKVGKDGKKSLTRLGRLAWPLKEQKIELLRRRLESLKNSLVLLFHVLQLANGQARGKLEESKLKEEKEKIRQLHQRQQDSIKSLEALERKLSKVSIGDDETLHGSNPSSRVATFNLMAMQSSPKEDNENSSSTQLTLKSGVVTSPLTDDSEMSDSEGTTTDEEAEQLTLDELSQCAKHVQNLLKRISTLQKSFQTTQPARRLPKTRVHKIYRRFCRKFESEVSTKAISPVGNMLPLPEFMHYSKLVNHNSPIGEPGSQINSDLIENSHIFQTPNQDPQLLTNSKLSAIPPSGHEFYSYEQTHIPNNVPSKNDKNYSALEAPEEVGRYVTPEVVDRERGVFSRRSARQLSKSPYSSLPASIEKAVPVQPDVPSVQPTGQQHHHHHLGSNNHSAVRRKPSQENLLPLSLPNEVGQEEMPPARPLYKGKNFTLEDDRLIIELKELKNLPWNQIAKFFPGRSSGNLQVRYCVTLKRLPRGENGFPQTDENGHYLVSKDRHAHCLNSHSLDEPYHGAPQESEVPPPPSIGQGPSNLFGGIMHDPKTTTASSDKPGFVNLPQEERIGSLLTMMDPNGTPHNVVGNQGVSEMEYQQHAQGIQEKDPETSPNTVQEGDKITRSLFPGLKLYVGPGPKNVRPIETSMPGSLNEPVTHPRRIQSIARKPTLEFAAPAPLSPIPQVPRHVNSVDVTIPPTDQTQDTEQKSSIENKVPCDEDKGLEVMSLGEVKKFSAENDTNKEENVRVRWLSNPTSIDHEISNISPNPMVEFPKEQVTESLPLQKPRQQIEVANDNIDEASDAVKVMEKFDRITQEFNFSQPVPNPQNQIAPLGIRVDEAGKPLYQIQAKRKGGLINLVSSKRPKRRAISSFPDLGIIANQDEERPKPATVFPGLPHPDRHPHHHIDSPKIDIESFNQSGLVPSSTSRKSRISSRGRFPVKPMYDSSHIHTTIASSGAEELQLYSTSNLWHLPNDLSMAHDTIDVSSTLPEPKLDPQGESMLNHPPDLPVGPGFYHEPSLQCSPISLVALELDNVLFMRQPSHYEIDYSEPIPPYFEDCDLLFAEEVNFCLSPPSDITIEDSERKGGEVRDIVDVLLEEWTVISGEPFRVHDIV